MLILLIDSLNRGSYMILLLIIWIILLILLFILLLILLIHHWMWLIIHKRMIVVVQYSSELDLFVNNEVEGLLLRLNTINTT